MHIPLYPKKKSSNHLTSQNLLWTTHPLHSLNFEILMRLKMHLHRDFIPKQIHCYNLQQQPSLVPKFLGLAMDPQQSYLLQWLNFTLSIKHTTLLFSGLRPALNKIYDTKHIHKQLSSLSSLLTKNTYGSTAKIKSKALVQCLCYKLCHHTMHQSKHINTL